VKGFTDLQVWRKAHDMTLAVYEVTRTFPSEEQYGLTSQMRRSAASIPANIAEGCGRRSDGEMARFLQIARGSASEIEYHIFLARELHYLNEDKFRELRSTADELQRMLTALIQRFRPSKKPEMPI
jgi:four helix bundle protein